MKVKISHTVDIEEVPKFINDIISGWQQKLLTQSKNLRYYANDLDRLYAEISRARESISLVDSQLEDVLNMATGLDSVLNPSSEAEPPEEIPDEIES